MSGELDKLADYLQKLEAHCVAGELDSAETILSKLDTVLKSIFSNTSLDLSDTQVKHLQSCYTNIVDLNAKLQTQKADISSQLSMHLGNKKKINAYKSI
ncbi:hypothetical protein [Pseudoalteromonas luteoviolacea]|uniref:Uncharacterized protein n=1 Tax=Pseudoalteromonas luteoviolacea S4054 TaxID=1129367 RepID=A0A0F6A7Y7_9GAMM|nr:hypothetical protein [Pseudoalteromonas luteoviolacea]AOT07448.1 hypothetical protein S4054249_06165 [Pseudoalteromonas luteoviolacea]AOT12364.1 hypothetical protein S40542_06165 [Pseudoalteromonas luteoviolacea]AOT17277.1 hypothetical protein S4054_06165 [Pseudoalteromonas luteoviolacea]KKE81961.1 hypothetical protein N479_20300 [Pseudoalteromonas luteoviolacea S4054]KZN74155.1 hypothetical protein N481_09245 [Pseudoalteromonas luteoviolacea S4047-1]